MFRWGGGFVSSNAGVGFLGLCLSGCLSGFAVAAPEVFYATRWSDGTDLDVEQIVHGIIGPLVGGVLAGKIMAMWFPDNEELE